MASATVLDAQIVCYGGHIWCRCIEAATVEVRFSLDSRIGVDRVKTSGEVNCGGGESNDGGDDE